MSVLKQLGIFVVGTTLFLLSWLFLGAFALGDRVLGPIPRTAKSDEYL